MKWTGNLTMQAACLSEPPPHEAESKPAARDFYPRLFARELHRLDSQAGEACNFITVFSALENFQRDLQECHEASGTLALAQVYLQSLGLFRTAAFLLSSPPDWVFQVATCLPAAAGGEIQSRVATEIQAGTFAWALRQSRPVVVQSRSSSAEAPLILHSLGTRSGVLGMFVGVPKDSTCRIKNLPLSLLSVILTSTACALENQRLRSEVQRHNEVLQQKIDERTAQLSATNAALLTEIDERQRAAETLASQTEQLNVTLRSIGEGVIATDTTGRVTMMNLSAEKLTGWQSMDTINRTLAEIFSVIDAKSGQPRADWLERALKADAAGGLSQNILLTDRNGHERLIAASAAPIHDHANERLGTVLVFRDVTAQERMAREMLKASKLESLTVLAGGIAHDFNNILTAIIGNVSLAATYPEDEKQPTWLSEATKASLRARDLTQQLLTFAKGGLPVKKTARLEETIRESTQFALHGANVRAEFSLAPDLWPVEADTGQLSQVIHNLVLNAVQAMPGGGQMMLRAQNSCLGNESSLPLPGGNYVKVSIQDFGGGIDPAHMTHIFEPFFTTKKTGSGLGLATCYAIIKKHNGHITLESTLGVGTTFHIFLPASDKQAPSPQAISFPRPAGGRGRVLVMEDDPQLRACLHAMLVQLGYAVCQANTSEEALRHQRETKQANCQFDVAILDLTIRGGGGAKETIQEMRALDPAIKVIVSTGYGTDSVVTDFEKEGFDGAISKPYNVEQLAQVLGAVMNSHGAPSSVDEFAVSV